MIIRRWSDHVMAAYTDEPDNPFGGRLIYVADRRETQSPQRFQRGSNVGSWENVGDRQANDKPVPAPHLSKQDRSLA